LSRPSSAPGSSGTAFPIQPSCRPRHGISSRLLTRAIRRVEARWRDLYGPSIDVADIPRILAASALAADRGDASFIDTLTPRPSLRLSLHLVDLLEDELLVLGRAGETPATQVLQTVGRLRVVRAAIERAFSSFPARPWSASMALSSSSNSCTTCARR